VSIKTKTKNKKQKNKNKKQKTKKQQTKHSNIEPPLSTDFRNKHECEHEFTTPSSR